MNILGDFINRVNALYPAEIDNEELNALLTTIRNQGDEIEYKDEEITRLRARLEKYEAAEEEKTAVKKTETKKAAPKKAPAKKAPAKKPAEPKPAAEPKAPEAPQAPAEPKAEEKK